MLDGTSSFLITRGTPGFHVTKCNVTMGCRFMNNGELTLEYCQIPASHMLVRDKALGNAGTCFRAGKIIQAAKNPGVGVACFERTAAFVQSHLQGGRLLITDQAVAVRLADMATRIEAVRALVGRAAKAVDQRHPDADILCDMAKVCASEEIMKVATHPLEPHGGHGANAPIRYRETVPRRGDFPAYGCDRGHQPHEDRQGDVPRHRWQIRST